MRTSHRRTQEYHLFLCQGLLGWMKFYTHSVPTASLPLMGKKVVKNKAERMKEIPDLLQSNVVNVLAGITMAVYRSVNDDQQTC